MFITERDKHRISSFITIAWDECPPRETGRLTGQSIRVWERLMTFVKTFVTRGCPSPPFLPKNNPPASPRCQSVYVPKRIIETQTHLCSVSHKNIGGCKTRL